jgi:hypothetical protein
MTAPKKLYRVRLAREVRQEAEVAVWAESAEGVDAAVGIAIGSHRNIRWSDEEATQPWVVSSEESA